MQTHTANKLAETFEIDRGTAIRALREVPPDKKSTLGRDEWKISTMARALEAHRAKVGTANHTTNTADNSIDPVLKGLYAKFDAADVTMRKLPTLAARRKAAIAMAPLIAETSVAMRKHGRNIGTDPELIDLRSDKIFLLTCRRLERPCSWSLDEAWAAMIV